MSAYIDAGTNKIKVSFEINVHHTIAEDDILGFLKEEIGIDLNSCPDELEYAQIMSFQPENLCVEYTEYYNKYECKCGALRQKKMDSIVKGNIILECTHCGNKNYEWYFKKIDNQEGCD